MMSSKEVEDGDTVPCSNCGGAVTAHMIQRIHKNHLVAGCPNCETTDVYLRDTDD